MWGRCGGDLSDARLGSNQRDCFFERPTPRRERRGLPIHRYPESCMRKISRLPAVRSFWARCAPRTIRLIESRISRWHERYS